MASFCQCTHIYFALKEMKANVYRKSPHTVAAVICSLNHFLPLNGRSGWYSAPSYRFRVKNSEDPRLQKHKNQVSVTSLWQASGSKKSHHPISSFHPFVVSQFVFLLPSATFSHFPMATKRWESAHYMRFLFNRIEFSTQLVLLPVKYLSWEINWFHWCTISEHFQKLSLEIVFRTRVHFFTKFIMVSQSSEI